MKLEFSKRLPCLSDVFKCTLFYNQNTGKLNLELPKRQGLTRASRIIGTNSDYDLKTNCSFLLAFQ